MRRTVISILGGFALGNILTFINISGLQQQVVIAGICLVGIIVINLFME